MKEYKRLTTKKYGTYLASCENCGYNNPSFDCDTYSCKQVLIKRLAELEDKIENGEMFSIPFIWKRKKCNNHNEFVLVYEGDYGSLLTELFIGENAETRAIKKLKEKENER